MAQARATGEHFPCGILGVLCLLPGPASPTNCSCSPAFKCAVHDQCHQELRASLDSPPKGLLCGGNDCQRRMTPAQSSGKLKVRDFGLIKAATLLDTSSNKCGAHQQCAAEPGSSPALSAICVSTRTRGTSCVRGRLAPTTAVERKAINHRVRAALQVDICRECRYTQFLKFNDPLFLSEMRLKYI